VLFRDTNGSFTLNGAWGNGTPITIRNVSNTASYTFTQTDNHVVDLELGGFDTRDFTEGVSSDELRARGWVDGSGTVSFKLDLVADGTTGSGAGFLNTWMRFTTALPRQLYTGQEYDAEGAAGPGGL
jgi:hypothetical protein